MLFSGLICQNINKQSCFTVDLLKVFTLCDGLVHAGLSILVELGSCLKKYVGLVKMGQLNKK